ncbi:hypothetical protein YQE_07537, partial [Dendroctonus ponderosae]
MSDTHEQHDNVAKVVSEKSALLRSFSTPEVQISRLPSPQRSVDFVLVWHTVESDSECDASEKRRIFEKNLIDEGLDLEYENQESSKLKFVKIPALRQVSHRTNFFVEGVSEQWAKVKEWIFLDKDKFPENDQQRFTAIYSRDREYLFDINSPCFFTSAIHSRIVQFILDRKRFSDNRVNDFAFGMERLIDDNVYAAAYPLHDGDLTTENTVRNLLYTEWACLGKWYRYQPLDCIKEYFGVKIALYFAWLGYYTHILLAPAIVGLACFIYSLATMYSHKPRLSCACGTMVGAEWDNRCARVASISAASSDLTL